ncbi:MAG: ABC transporter ATP-binding protein [Alphaproteobacteria bacterium]|nr:ABC transporter ATP-binding protein [Alphaproteobacteria bacterium]
MGLRADGVSHRYGAVTALEGVSLDIPAGETTVIVGPSGCGKSTLLGILGGLLRPSAGEVTVEGSAPEACLNRLTYVFQDFALLPWRTVAGNVALVLEPHGLSRAAREARIAEVLAMTGLSEFADAWPRQLSGGMRQRVGIARALAVRPAVLLMDEPLSALDAQTRELLLDEVWATVVWVTHNLAEAVRLGERIVVMSRRPGRIRAVLRRGEAAASEAGLWAMIRDEAADAARELAHG